MVIGWPHRDEAAASGLKAAASPWKCVEATQRHLQFPCLLVPQPAHAVLAGELAQALVAEAFGELPEEIMQAIRMHDTGWAMSDAQQIQRLRSGSPQAGKANPISFVAIPPRETVEAWLSSIETVASESKAGAMIVSRHFSLLAMPDQMEHQRFAKAEKERRKKLGDGSLASDADLERWTAALGLCDLVSLYLLTGFDGEAVFPLAHPASPQAKTARQVALRREGGRLGFTPAIFRAGSLTLQALKHPLPAQGPRAETLSWEIV